MSQRPLIGITGFETVYPKPPYAPLYATGQRYVRAIEDAGGLPVILSPGSSTETLLAAFARLEGLLLSGGGDIDPAIYGEEQHPTIWGLDMNRDRKSTRLNSSHGYISNPDFCLEKKTVISRRSAVGGGRRRRNAGSANGVP